MKVVSSLIVFGLAVRATYISTIAIVCGLVSLGSGPLEAGTLNLIPTIRFGNLSTADKLELAGIVLNQSSEAATEVKIESVRTKRVVADLGALNGSENKDLAVNVGLSDLGISGPGYYQIPLRLLYTDSNHMKLSSIFMLDYFFKKDADATKSSPVLIALEEAFRESGRFEIGRKGELRFSLRNTSAEKQAVTLEVFGSKELNFQPDRQTLELSPQEERVLQISVENPQGLMGSNYAGYAIVSGIASAQVFTEYAGFIVGLVSGYAPNWSTWLLLVLIVIFAIFGYAQWKKSVKTENADEEEDA